MGILVSTISFSACKIDRPLHIWSQDWSSNNVYHWHACTDNGCPAKDEATIAKHEFELISTDKAATCSAEGKGRYKCSVCGYEKDDVIEKLPHSLTLTSTLLAPSCISPGLGNFKCTVCGESVKEQTIEPTGAHIYGSSYLNDENNHWHKCIADERCTAIDAVAPHKAGLARTTQPNGWLDGKIDTPCGDCGYIMKTEVIPNKKAPVSYDLQFTAGGTTVSLIPGEEEYDGKPTYKINLVAGTVYKTQLVNAVNADGEELNLAADISWFIGTGTDTHGLRVYLRNDRSGSETLIEKYSTYGGITWGNNSSDINFIVSKGEYTVIFRYQTGINDNNYHTGSIRVEHVVRITAA